MDKLAEYLKLNSRQTSILEVGGFRPTLDPTTSHFGLTPLAKQGESWPHNQAGEPLQFICQLNLLQAPFVPDILKDIALITFFVDKAQRFIAESFPTDSWCVRAYSSLEQLVPLVKPNFTVAERDQWLGARGFEAGWLAQVTDHPIYDDPERVTPPGFSEEDMDEIDERRNEWEHIYRTKIGGYPSNLQHGVYWGDYSQDGRDPLENKVAFAFQIASEAKAGLNWVDGGFVYVGRALTRESEQQWFVSCQFY
jgi:uncharacterized protein YwqG